MEDTIAAIATPRGAGAIGIIRLSGKNAIEIASKIFSSPDKISLKEVETHTIHFGYITSPLENHKVIDTALFSVMKAPRTYTGEDIVEISTHCNPLILKDTVELLVRLGARIAEPGEFTKRAFLNGKMDLVQAEAVVEIINAKTEDQLRISMEQLKGELSRKIKEIQNSIYNILMPIEAELDFPDEDVGETDYQRIKEQIQEILNQVEKLLKSYSQGKVIEEGVKVAIIGRYNCGKSSLFNLLVEEEERVIVSPQPGTTRDRVEEEVVINGRLFTFVDTAGFKTPCSKVEEESMKQTKKAISKADICLFMMDNNKAFHIKDLNLLEEKPYYIIVINKTDLPCRLDQKRLRQAVGNRPIIRISCKEKKGIEEVKETVYRVSEDILNKANSTLLLTNLRHKNLLEECRDHLFECLNAIDSGYLLEFIAEGLKKSIQPLQELTGEKVTDNLLDDIFRNFCIGK